MQGKHSIDVSVGYEGVKCGLLPIGGKCDEVTTNGLKWNLSKFFLVFLLIPCTINHSVNMRGRIQDNIQLFTKLLMKLLTQQGVVILEYNLLFNIKKFLEETLLNIGLVSITALKRKSSQV